jgi:hypothetical protein
MLRLAGVPVFVRTRGRDSPDVPLLRFNPPLRLIPETSALSLSTQDNSHGILVPYNASGNQSPRPPSRPGNPPGQEALRTSPKTNSASAGRSHPANYGAAPRLSQPLSDFIPLSYRPAIFRQVTFMGFALQGFVPFAKPPATHRPRNTLMSLLPPVAQLQVLGKKLRWAHDPLPRMARHHTIDRLQGLSPHKSQSRIKVTIRYVLSTRLAPLGLSPPHGIYPSRCAGLTLRDRHASEPLGLLPDQEPLAFHGLTTEQGRPLSHETDQPSQGSSPSLDLPTWPPCGSHAF